MKNKHLSWDEEQVLVVRATLHLDGANISELHTRNKVVNVDIVPTKVEKT